MLPTQTPRVPSRPAAPARARAWLRAEEARELALALGAQGLDVGDALVATFFAVAARYGSGASPRLLARHAARSPGRALSALPLRYDGAELFRSLTGRVHDALTHPPGAVSEDAEGALSLSFAEALPEGEAALAPGQEMAVSAAHTAAGLELVADWDERLFERWFVERLLEHTLLALRAGATAPDRRVDRLPLLSEDERRRILEEWNDTREPYPRSKRVHTLFEEVARENPDATAAVGVRAGDVRTLRYAELDQDADRVADVLYRRGALSDEPIGVLAPRSAVWLSAVLGVWKAGAAVLPLDPALPRDRLAAMLEDAEVRFVLAPAELRARCPGAAEVLALEDLLGGEPPPSPPSTDDDPEQLACLPFTSGALGRPDGVLVPHRALVNLFDTLARRPGLRAEDRVLALSSPSHPAALVEAFAPLLVGATVVVADDEEVADPSQIAALIAEHAVTVLHAPPRLWRELLLELGDDPDAAVAMRAWCSGGPVPAALGRALADRCGEAWHFHGAPEAGCFSLAHRLQTDLASRAPAGRPLGNTAAYVLDEHKQPVPVGVTGELFLGGDGVGRGLLKRPALTRERFLPDPFRKEGGARMVRTGELARFREDGQLEVTGSSARRVWRAGQRVELGEVERVLERAEGVEKAVVAATDADDPLHAWLRGEGEHPSDDALRSHLSARLPAAFVPASFTWVSRFPLHRDGRVDEAQLLSPGTVGAPAPRARRSRTEARVLEVWRRVLGARDLKATDRFFDVGGDAALATRLFGELAQATGARLPVDTLLAAPDAASVARVLDGDAPSVRGRAAVVVQAGDTRPPVFCLSSVAGDCLRFAALAAETDRERRFLGLRWPGLDGEDVPLTDVESLSEFFIPKVIKSSPDGPVVLAGYGFGGAVAFELGRRLADRGHRVPLVVLLDAPGPGLGFVGEKLAHAAAHLSRLRQRDASERADYLGRWLRAGVPRLARRKARYHELALGRGPLARDDATRRLLRAHAEASERWTPAGKFPGPGLLVRALSLPLGLEGRQEEAYGWDGLFRDGLEVAEVRAAPDELLHEPAVRSVARPLARALAKL